MLDVVVRAAIPAEAGELSELALRSKGHWGYDEAFLAACRPELTMRGESCDGVRVVVAERGGVLLGYYRLAGVAPLGELAELWVDPPGIGRGVGRLLLEHALRNARGLGFEVLVLDADPHAEEFYLRAGATRVGQVAGGSVAGRLLPRLELPVPQAL